MQIRPLTLAALIALFTSSCLRAQSQQVDPRPSRIAPYADLTPKTRLSGHLPAWVTPQADSGLADDSTPVVLTFLLARTTSLQSSFDQLVADQHNPSSPRFQQWLTPSQIGDQYGPTLAEIASVTQWLRSQGLQVTSVSPSRTFIQATGPASAASAAFSIAFHLFDVDGHSRLAPATDPTIPTALASIILSVEGLADIPFRSFHSVHQADQRPAADSVHPQSTSPQGAHYLYPGDFARIYDIVATTGAGYDGTGVKVAIAGQSRITSTDITELQAMAGLPAKAPNTILVPTSSDPGLVKGDEDESTLDVTRILTSAPGVQADLVIASSPSGGVSTAIQYSINTLVDPILSISYGACEASASASSVQFYNLLFQQAAAEGISTFVSSGDSAAAGCAQAFTTPTGSESLAMGNYLCSSSYVTCVGGTEFAETGSAPTYWSSTNSSNNVSALGYIPEGAWNEPSVAGSGGSTTYQIAGSGSGPSAYITKPTWQTGTGVPADGARDIPDIAFSAANHDGYFACLAYLGAGGDCSKGGGVVFSGTSATAPGMAAIAALLDQRMGKSQGNLNPLLYRLAASNPEAFHDATPASSGVATCATSTPSLCNNSVAAHAALTGGLAGYGLQTGYDLVTGLGSLDVTNFLNAAAGKTITASTIAVTASASTVAIGQTVTLTASVDTTGGPAPTGTVQFFSNATPLTTALAVANVVVSPPLTFSTAGSDTITAVYSGDSNYTTSTSPALTLTVASIPAAIIVVSAAPSTVAIGQPTVYTATVTAPTGSSIVPTGTVQFTLNGTPVAMPQTLKAGTASLSVTPTSAGTFTLTAIYSGDTNYTTSTSPASTLTVTTVPAAIIVVSAAPSSITIGQPTVYSATVTASTATGTVPTGTVQFALNGTPVATPQTLKAGIASLSATPSVTGTFALTAVYSGDANNGPSTSPAVALLVQAAPTVTALAASSNLLNAGDAAVFTATVSTTSALSPTGTVQFFNGSTPLGSATLTGASATMVSAFPVAGNYPVTAVYSGNASFSTSTSSPATLTVNPLGTISSLSLTVTPNVATLSAAAVNTANGTVTLATDDSFTGAVTLVCTVTAGFGNPQTPPACTLSTNSVVFNSARTATATVMLSTETPQAQQNLNPIARVAPGGSIGSISLAALCILFPFARRRKLLALLPLLLIGTMLPITGCGSTISAANATGGTGGSSTPTVTGTTAGTYTVTLLAASGSVSASTVLTLTVK